LPNFWKRFTKNGKSSKCNPEIMQFWNAILLLLKCSSQFWNAA
jgi:hypothetical protein